MCNIQTLKYQAAISDLKKVLQLEPHNQQVKTQLDSTQKLWRRIEFEKVRC
jgi:serine/threonine-protein phosphatase 5